MLFPSFLLNIYDLLWKCCECSTSLELIDYYKWVKIAKYGRENIGTIETREKNNNNKFFGSSVFNKNDGKVKNYYYSLNEGTFVILLLKVIFFLIFPLQLGRNQLVWIGWKTHPYLFFLTFFPYQTMEN